ncbi:MAG: HAD family hydrolase [Bacteroidales bacterium]|nr:HAD family hydrolase [Bacteroidales bacterium]
MERRIRNLIFDFDGTLLDTAPIILDTMQATIRELGLPARSEAECRATIGLRLEEIGRRLFPDNQEAWETYAPTYRRIFAEHNQPGRAVPFPGVVETIEALAASGYNLAIATSRSHWSLQEFVEQMGWQGVMKQLVGGDDVSRGKPAPDAALKILSEQGWKAEETMMVGDMTYDILMGKAAGLWTCGVTYGNGSRRELEEAGADWVIDRFEELIATHKLE